MQEPANNPAGPLRAGIVRARILNLTVGGLMILEGALVALLSLGFLIAPGILSVFAVIAIVSGGTICWGGSVLAGIVQGNQKAAAVLVLILGIAIASFGFLVMVFAICGGGVSCPARIPAQVVAFPIAFAAFNAMCACLLWWRRTA